MNRLLKSLVNSRLLKGAERTSGAKSNNGSLPPRSARLL